MSAVAKASPGTISLRGYQRDAIDAVRREMGAGRRRVVLVLPTGAGKTRTASAIVASALAKGTRVLWLAHRKELVDQAAGTLEGFGLDVGCEAASSKRRARPEALCQVASVQTLLARATRPPAGLIVWDEAHHASNAAECWAGLLDAYVDVPMVGLTATPERGDGAGLAPLFNGIVVGATVRELIALWETDATQGLVPCEIIRPGRMLEPGEIAQDPVDAYRAHGGDRQAILFARTVWEAGAYASRLTEGGVRAECVTATTPAVDREAAIELFRRGVVRVLCNVYVLTEGTDLPMAEVCILARGAGSCGIYIQMVGRVLRPYPGKRSALLLDLKGVSHHHGCPEDERLYSLDGRGIRLATGLAGGCVVCKQLLGGGYPCEHCGYAPTGGADAAQTVVTWVPLEKFARMIAQGPAQREETLRRWVKQALDRGHKPTSVRYKWRAIYKEELSAARLMSAVAEVSRV